MRKLRYGGYSFLGKQKTNYFQKFNLIFLFSVRLFWVVRDVIGPRTSYTEMLVLSDEREVWKKISPSDSQWVKEKLEEYLKKPEYQREQIRFRIRHDPQSDENQVALNGEVCVMWLSCFSGEDWKKLFSLYKTIFAWPCELEPVKENTMFCKIPLVKEALRVDSDSD